MKRIIFLLLFLFSFGVYGNYDIVADFKLKNGLRVICINKKTLPIVCFSVFYNCGSVNEEASKSGVAHYLEHMAFCGDKGIFSQFLESVGAEYNAFTSLRYICFYEIVSNAHLEEIIKNEARRMEHIDVDQEKFVSEKGAILEERNMRTDNAPFGQFIETFAANVFNRQLGGILPIGWRNEIEKTEPKDIVDFHDKWFAPNNAIVLVVGDVDVERVKSLTKKYFGPIKSKKIEKLSEYGPRPSEYKEIELRSKKIGSSATVVCSYYVPFSVKQNHRKCIALYLATSILNQPLSFARKTLEHTLNSATNASFEYDNGNFQYDVFNIAVTCSSIDNLSEAEDVLPYIKDKILVNGISKAELEREKQRRAVSNAYRDDDISNIAMHIWYDLGAGFTIEQIRTMDDVMQSITVDECNEVLFEILENPPITISRILPKEQDRD